MLGLKLIHVSKRLRSICIICFSVFFEPQKFPKVLEKQHFKYQGWNKFVQNYKKQHKTSRGHIVLCTVYPKKFAHGFCFAVLCCGYTLTDFPISIRLTSLALWQSNDCPSASKPTLMNMDKYFMWINYERLHNHNKAKHNKTVCIFLGIYCTLEWISTRRSNQKLYFQSILYLKTEKKGVNNRYLNIHAHAFAVFLNKL